MAYGTQADRGVAAPAAASSINTRVVRLEQAMNRLVALNEGLYKCLTRINGGIHRPPSVPQNASKIASAKESPSYAERLDEIAATLDEQLDKFNFEMSALASELE